MLSPILSATPANANNAEVDLLGSLALAIVPTTTTSEAESTNPNSVSASTFVAAPLASNVTNQVAVTKASRVTSF